MPVGVPYSQYQSLLRAELKALHLQFDAMFLILYEVEAFENDIKSHETMSYNIQDDLLYRKYQSLAKDTFLIIYCIILSDMAKIYSYAYFLGILSYALPKIDISCSALFEALCLNKRKTRNAEDLSKIANGI